MSGTVRSWKQLLIATILTATAVIGFGSVFSPVWAGKRVQAAAPECEGPLSQRLLKAALAAPDAAQNDGTLYGVQRWRKPTSRSYVGLKFPGVLSCAYTVSAIFRGACHPIGEIASVNGIDAALGKWKKVRDPRALQPGDVVFWKPSRGSILGIDCPGHWHVGIFVGGDSTIDNDWWSGKPKKGSLKRACTTFAYARRAPTETP